MCGILAEEIYSIGVDIGTSTTEVIISKLKVKNVLSASLINETVIEKKEIIYKSPVVFTPLLDEVIIDFMKIRTIVSEAIKLSSVEKSNISTGAVIITGETARKENASEVSKNLSEYLGDFVVATAGPKLESLLSGYGSGAYDISKKLNRRIINLDIGGGTTNISIFNSGECEQVFALDIGGRLIKFDEEGKVSYISKRIEFLIDNMKLDIRTKERPKLKELERVCKKMAKCLLETCCLKELGEDTKRLFISELFEPFKADFISFSGGIGEYINQTKKEIKYEDMLIQNDIGVLLGKCISEEFENYKSLLLESVEKIRATVIGAGNHSMTISGSTIAFNKNILPLKNIPIVKLFDGEEDFENIHFLGNKKFNIYEDTPIAVSFIGPKSPSYQEIRIIAFQVIMLFKKVNGPIIVVLENDFAKALGQVISLNLKEKKEVICIDKISTNNGDYIDIGMPIGNALPVVIKTLIYNC